MSNEYLARINNILDVRLKLYDTCFGDLSKVYSMTTENINGYMKLFDIKDKDVLTVAGSGDHMFNAYSFGARNVTLFDINPLTFYHINLKKEAIKSLSYEEFIDFFGILYQDDYLDKSIYKRLEKRLNQNTREFYDFLYKKYGRNSINYALYFDFKSDIDLIKKINNYMDDDNYYKLANILRKKNEKNIICDVKNLKDYIGNNKYDFIFLSNINDYLIRMYGDNCLEKYKDLIISLTDNLNDNGIIEVGYIYNYDFKQVENNPFRVKKKRQDVFTTDLFHSLFIEPYDNICNYSDCRSGNDQVIIYQKCR